MSVEATARAILAKTRLVHGSRESDESEPPTPPRVVKEGEKIQCRTCDGRRVEAWIEGGVLLASVFDVTGAHQDVRLGKMSNLGYSKPYSESAILRAVESRRREINYQTGFRDTSLVEGTAPSTYGVNQGPNYAQGAARYHWED